MTLQMPHVTDLGGGNYKVRMTVSPDLIGIIKRGNLTRTIRDPDPREARAKLHRIIAEFETTLVEARAELRGSRMVWQTILPGFKLEFRNLDPETATTIRDLVLAKYPNLAPALMQRGGFGSWIVHQRADTPAEVRHSINRKPVSFVTIIEAWVREKRPLSQTEGIFRSKVAALTTFLTRPASSLPAQQPPLASIGIRRYCRTIQEHDAFITGRSAMFFTFPENASWNADRSAVEFGIEIGEYAGTVRVGRRVFQHLKAFLTKPRFICRLSDSALPTLGSIGRTKF